MLLMIREPHRTLAERARLGLRDAAGAALSLAVGALEAPLRAIENRRLVGALGGLSDHELRDVGLVRGDIGDAAALGGARDAGLFLAARRGERRAATVDAAQHHRR